MHVQALVSIFARCHWHCPAADSHFTTASIPHIYLRAHVVPLYSTAVGCYEMFPESIHTAAVGTAAVQRRYGNRAGGQGQAVV